MMPYKQAQKIAVKQSLCTNYGDSTAAFNRDLSVAAWLKGMQVDVDAQRGHAQAQKIQFDGQMYAAGLRLDYSYPLSQKMQIQPYLDASFQHYVHAEQTQR